MSKMWAIIALVVVLGLLGWNLLRDPEPAERFDTEPDTEAVGETDSEGG